MTSLYLLHTAHIEWLGLRKSLQGQERRYFVRWFCRSYASAVQGDLPSLTLLRQQCRDIQHGSRNQVWKQLNEQTLKQYAESLVRIYLADQHRGTFRDFLEEVLRQCRSEIELKIFVERRLQTTT